MGVPGEVYNISTEDELTNLELVKLMGELFGKRNSEQLMEFVPDRTAHDFRYGIDSSKARAALAWEPEISLREGLSSLLGK